MLPSTFRRAFLALTTLLAASWLVTACSSASPSIPAGSTGAQQASETIGAAGGIVLTSDGTSVSIPRGALSHDVTITIAADPTAPVPSEGTPVGDNYLFGPEGQQFDVPVTITLAFDPSQLDPGESAGDLVVYTAPLGSTEYTALQTSIVDSMHVSVTTTHFSHYVTLKHALQAGVYVSVARDTSSSVYIGNWPHNWGYALGYFTPGAIMYAKRVVADDGGHTVSVYGLITNSHYGAWDDGHHCGWIDANDDKAVRGSGSSSPGGDTCPEPVGDFDSNASRQPEHLFVAHSWDTCKGGCVQPAQVLSTCQGDDLTVYANYDPVSHTFSDPSGWETPVRGTTPSASEGTAPCSPYGDYPGVPTHDGYCGFGTRYKSLDGFAVLIKDTLRESHDGTGKDVTTWGFMHSYCIAGEKVGEPAGSYPCGTLEPGHDVASGGPALASCNGQYAISIEPSTGELVETDTSIGAVYRIKGGKAGDRLDMNTDGDLALYAGDSMLWQTKTGSHPGARLLVKNDGELEVYNGRVLWSWRPPPAPPPESGVCCALCATAPEAYYAAVVEGSTCAQAAAAFCSYNDFGAVVSTSMGTCPAYLGAP
jgi:hypothetical protein